MRHPFKTSVFILFVFHRIYPLQVENKARGTVTGPQHLSQFSRAWVTIHRRRKNPDELSEKMRATTELGNEKTGISNWGANPHEDASQQSRLPASHFRLMLRAAGRAVSPMSVLNDCWMIYQVAGGSSVWHCTWAEWEKGSPLGIKKKSLRL